jgi:hypothetical protein
MSEDFLRQGGDFESAKESEMLQDWLAKNATPEMITDATKVIQDKGLLVTKWAVITEVCRQLQSSQTVPPEAVSSEKKLERALLTLLTRDSGDASIVRLQDALKNIVQDA